MALNDIPFDPFQSSADLGMSWEGGGFSKFFEHFVDLLFRSNKLIF